jgi:predicted carbohydrate-binding protein with CBM5 and CBM33 domain
MIRRLGDTFSTTDPSVFHHGRVTVSRATLWGQKHGQEWVANGLEAGKFFPQTASGRQDPFAADDVPNAVPPPDGKIASAGIVAAAPLDGTEDSEGNAWPRQSVSSGSALVIEWTYTMKHKTRRWNYFITKTGWNPAQPLARAQFEDEPFYFVQNACQPYWGCDSELTPEEPTRHTMTLPTRKGYHVLLGVWEVADTGNAFYQAVDLEFS